MPDHVIRHVLRYAMAVVLTDGPNGTMQMHLGFSPVDATPIEVGTVVDPVDGPIAIHAMRMRRTMMDRLTR